MPNRRCDACCKETAFSSDGFCEECGRNLAASRIYASRDRGQPSRISSFIDETVFIIERSFDYLSKNILFLAMVFTIGFAVWSNFGSPIWSNEQKVYRAACLGTIISGECTSRSSPSAPLTFKAIDTQQTVVYWADENLPSRLDNCVVRNHKNWHCTSKTTSGDFLYMQDGVLISSRQSLDLQEKVNSQAVIYQVPKWKWGLYKLRSYFTRAP